MAVTLYRRRQGQGSPLPKGQSWARAPTDQSRRSLLLRYSLADGTRPWEAVDDDLDAAIEAQKRKQCCGLLRLPDQISRRAEMIGLGDRAILSRRPPEDSTTVAS